VVVKLGLDGRGMAAFAVAVVVATLKAEEAGDGADGGGGGFAVVMVVVMTVRVLLGVLLGVLLARRGLGGGRGVGGGWGRGAVEAGEVSVVVGPGGVLFRGGAAAGAGKGAEPVRGWVVVISVGHRDGGAVDWWVWWAEMVMVEGELLRSRRDSLMEGG
jgi:hypothetical protein